MRLLSWQEEVKGWRMTKGFKPPNVQSYSAHCVFPILRSVCFHYAVGQEGQVHNLCTAVLQKKKLAFMHRFSVKHQWK